MCCKRVFEPERLPPTSRAAYFHGLRVHHQIVSWMMIDTNDDSTLSVDEWGWELDDGLLVPVKTDIDVAPENLLQIVRCNCKSLKNQCGSNLCTCRKHGLPCSKTCGSCHGEDCLNKMVKTNEFFIDDLTDDDEPLNADEEGDNIFDIIGRM
jgi:hypothetical protein